MTKVIDLHNVRKTQTGFKGSIINMSFKLSRTAGIVQALDDAHAAGISLVASSGNKGYRNNHWPSAHPKVISVGGNTKNYKPRCVNPIKGSNFGKDEIDIWAPGEDVALLDQNGFKRCGSGTSYASAYVSGILAIFYGVEGASLTPDGARDLLFANSDNYIDLTPTQPSGAPVDWHNSPTIMANTGYLKGQALSPKVPFLPKSVPPALQPATAPVAGYQSPNHDDPLRPFTLDQGDAARSYFIAECQGVELSPGKVEGCVAYFNPCSEKFGAKAVSVILSMQQISWGNGTKSVWADRQEMAAVTREIMNNCDTSTVQEKWGGFKSIEADSGVRMYNVTATQNGQYPTISDRWATRAITSGRGDCDIWNSD